MKINSIHKNQLADDSPDEIALNLLHTLRMFVYFSIDKT